MKWWARFGQYLMAKGVPQPKQVHQDVELSDILVRVRRLIHTSRYDDALEELALAHELVTQSPSVEGQVYIGLCELRILGHQEKTDQIEGLVIQLRQQIHQAQRIDLEVLLEIEQGVISKRLDQDKAEQHFERALALARKTADLNLEGIAQAHIADVGLDQGNASFAAYLLKAALPKVKPESDETPYFIGRLGQAMIAIGELREGDQYLGKALRMSEMQGYVDHQCLWRQTLALRAMERGNYGEARRHWVAVLIHRRSDDIEYVIGLCRLHQVCQLMGDNQAALDYAAQALELSKSQGADALAISQAAMGISLRSVGRNQEALPYLMDAASRYAFVDKSHQLYNLVEIMRNLAAIQTEIEDFEPAAVSYQTALKWAEANGSQLDLAGIYYDRGILFFRQSQLDQSASNWSAALAIYEKENQHDRAARLHCEIAKVHKIEGRFRRAQDHCNKALLLLSSIGDDETRGIVLANAAAYLVDRGDIETAEAFLVESIRLAQQTGDRAAEATRRGNYGWFLLSTGRPDRAIASLAYALRQSEALDMPLQTAVQTDNMGLAHYEMGNINEAIKFHRRALELISMIGDRGWEAVIQANLARSHIDNGEYTEARELLHAARQIAIDKNKPDLLARVYVGLVRISLAENKLDLEASHWVEQAMSLAERVNSRRLLADALIVRSDFFAHLEQTESAQRDWIRATELLDILGVSITRHEPQWVREARESQEVKG